MWPPTLEDLKADMASTQEGSATTRDDVALTSCLNAAIAKVEEVKWDIDFTEDVLDARPKPNAAIVLGTLRQAGRWFMRRSSPEGLVPIGDLASARIPSFDVDIERLLGIGRYKRPVIA